MKLLLDQNISHKLVKALAATFRGTSHVCVLGLHTASDEEVWKYARAKGFVIVTQDSDFSERGAIHGHPPKVVWLRVGNTSTHFIETVLLGHKKEILAFGKDTKKGCLILW